MATLNWEEVGHNWIWRSSDDSSGFPAFRVLRARVPGGLLITIQETFVRHQPDFLEVPGGLTLVPDPTHSWA